MYQSFGHGFFVFQCLRHYFEVKLILILYRLRFETNWKWKIAKYNTNFVISFFSRFFFSIVAIQFINQQRKQKREKIVDKLTDYHMNHYWLESHHLLWFFVREYTKVTGLTTKRKKMKTEQIIYDCGQWATNQFKQLTRETEKQKYLVLEYFNFLGGLLIYWAICDLWAETLWPLRKLHQRFRVVDIANEKKVRFEKKKKTKFNDRISTALTLMNFISKRHLNCTTCLHLMWKSKGEKKENFFTRISNHVCTVV